VTRPRSVHFPATRTFDLFRAIRKFERKEPIIDEDHKKALDDFIELLGESTTRHGITFERDEDYAIRQEMGVRAERKGKRITIILEGVKP
jgi:hypothetical protein